MCLCVQNYYLELSTIAIGLAASRIRPLPDMTQHWPAAKLLPQREYLLLSITVALWLVSGVLSFAFFALKSPLAQGNGTSYLVIFFTLLAGQWQSSQSPARRVVHNDWTHVTLHVSSLTSYLSAFLHM